MHLRFQVPIEFFFSFAIMATSLNYIIYLPQIHKLSAPNTYKFIPPLPIYPYHHHKHFYTFIYIYIKNKKASHILAWFIYSVSNHWLSVPHIPMHHVPFLIHTATNQGSLCPVSTSVSCLSLENLMTQIHDLIISRLATIHSTWSYFWRLLRNYSWSPTLKWPLFAVGHHEWVLPALLGPYWFLCFIQSAGFMYEPYWTWGSWRTTWIWFGLTDICPGGCCCGCSGGEGS